MPIGSLIGGMIGKGGADAAASGINSAASNSNFMMGQQRKENRSDLSPWTATGTSAIGQIGSLLGYGSLWNRGGDGATYNFEADPNAQGNAINALRSYAGASGANLPTYTPVNYLNQVSDTFSADPSYAFRQAEGQKALEHGAAARGKLLSGEQFKGLSDFNSNLASQEYGNWYNRFLQQSNFNQGANAQNFGQQQQLFQDQYGQWRDAVGDVFNASGQGAGATNSLAGQNSGLTTAGGNALLQGAMGAGQATMSGANALASGIGKGISNAATLAWMGFNPTSGIFSGSGAGAIPNPASMGYSVGSVAGRTSY